MEPTPEADNPGSAGIPDLVLWIIFGAVPTGAVLLWICVILLLRLCDQPIRRIRNQDRSRRPQGHVTPLHEISSTPCRLPSTKLVLTADPACPICIEQVSGSHVHALNCGHLFHEACINAWLARTPKPPCPVCRSGIAVTNCFLVEPT